MFKEGQSRAGNTWNSSINLKLPPDIEEGIDYIHQVVIGTQGDDEANERWGHKVSSVRQCKSSSKIS